MGTKKKTASSRPRSTALMRAERHTPAVNLSGADTKLLQRALAEGQDLANALEAAVLRFGRWLVVEVFSGDAAAAMDDRSQNPVWLELTRRAGGPTLPISRRMLYVAVAIAANDHRITDQAWQRLDVQRKQILLPLREPAALRQAAQQVSKWNLTQQQTQQLVTTELGRRGKSRQVRLTRAGLLSRVRRVSQSLTGEKFPQRMEELAARMTPVQRTELLREVERSLAALDQVKKRLAIR